MTMIAAITLMTLIMTVAMVPRIYWALVRAGELGLEQDRMQKLLCQRDWVLRHQRCSLVALFLIWTAKACPGLEVPPLLAAAITSYAASSLLLVVLQSLLAQKTDGILASVPVRVRVRD